MTRGYHQGVTQDGLLEVTCWCELARVRVRPEDIRRGLTASCGRPTCRPPAA